MRALAALVPLALLAACGAPEMSRGERMLRPAANPGAVIAAEIAFNRLAQTKGQWAAFRETSTADAVMFVPQPANAHQWLKDRAEPAARLAWQPHQVWSSCDATLALTKGAWQRGDGKVGYFTTLWRRQQDSGYKWVLDQGDTLGQPLEEPEMISSAVADCSANSVPVPPAPVAGAGGTGFSTDNSMTYSYAVSAEGHRTLSVSIRRDGQMQEVLRSDVREGEGVSN